MEESHAGESTLEPSDRLEHWTILGVNVELAVRVLRPAAGLGLAAMLGLGLEKL